MNPPETVLAEMRKTNDIFCSRAIASRDFAVLDQVYTVDARILPPGMEMISGIAAIKDFWSQAVSSLDVKAAALSTLSAEIVGDDVVEIGRAELTLGNAQQVPIKYVVHWKSQAGQWKWHIDIWNMNS